MSVDTLRIEDRLRLLGFRDMPNTGGSLDVTIAGVHVIATPGLELLFLVEYYAGRHASLTEHWAPLDISVQDIANRLWKFAVNVRPDLVPREVRWSQDMLKRIRNSRPSVSVNRSEFRNTVRALRRQLGEDYPGDIVIRFEPVPGEQGFGLVSFCDEEGSLSLVGQGVWVGGVRVKAPDLLRLLESRFRQDPTWITVCTDGIQIGHIRIEGRWEDDADWT
jgi:hypothetical protein